MDGRRHLLHLKEGLVFTTLQEILKKYQPLMVIRKVLHGDLQVVLIGKCLGLQIQMGMGLLKVGPQDLHYLTIVV